MISFYHIDCLEVVQNPGEEGQDVGLQEPSVWELNVRKAEDTNQRCSWKIMNLQDGGQTERQEDESGISGLEVSLLLGAFPPRHVYPYMIHLSGHSSSSCQMRTVLPFVQTLLACYFFSSKTLSSTSCILLWKYLQSLNTSYHLIAAPWPKPSSLSPDWGWLLTSPCWACPRLIPSPTSYCDPDSRTVSSKIKVKSHNPTKLCDGFPFPSAWIYQTLRLRGTFPELPLQLGL